MAEPTVSITFRFPEAFVPVLDEQAKRYGESRHMAARRLVIAALHDTARDEFRDELAELKRSDAELKQSVALLREDLATACVALLTRQQAVPHKQAESWVRDNLLR